MKRGHQPAYPVTAENSPARHNGSNGITIREQIAGQVLAGLAMNTYHTEIDSRSMVLKAITLTDELLRVLGNG